ncbi:MAG TPA: NUDIX domain-containing protein [Candidatus Moranbacteria bacterium]|nr:NUDIX domain-containing protein [Candidatus Moranbacteria bacterium]
MKFFSFEKSVGAVVFRMENGERKYLLLKYQGGHWSFPKGHIEKGETHEETLRREVLEETGIKTLKIIPKFSSSSKYFYVAKDEEKEKRQKSGKGYWVFKKVFYYLTETEEKEIKISGEHKDYSWLNYEEAKKRATYANCRRILEEADNFLASI